MFACRSVLQLSLVCLGFSIIGCGSSGLDSIQVTPATQALTVGQTAQFIAQGTYGNANHTSTQNITTGVTWTSSAPAVATVNSAGIATAVGAGSTTITASASAYKGPASSSAVLTVTGSSGGVAGGTITSMAIIPGTQAVSAPTQTTQFLAIGTTSSGATVNLTNQVAWSSSSSQIATVGTTSGLATAVGQGSATITAIYTNTAGGTVVTGTATFTVAGGTVEKFTAVSITPPTQSLSASGQTSQLIALGTAGTNGLQTNVTNSSQITWISSVPTIASVSASGLVTGLSAGSATITAQLTNADSTVVSNTAVVTVSLTTAPEPLLSLTIIPSVISVGNLQDTGQFLAIGTFSTLPYVRDLTNSSTLKWLSSFPNDFPVNTNSGGNQGTSAGLVTAYASGSATIIAEATSTDGTIQTATATFNCPQALANPGGDPPTLGTCVPGTQAPSLLATLTVYTEGLNYNTEGLNNGNAGVLITASSATGTPNVLHCGTGLGDGGVSFGASVCVATYPPNTPIVVLREHAEPGINFGGWSSSCTPSDSTGNTSNPPPITATGNNYCSFSINSQNTNITVGAIFN
jgi:uncharacterized protein YjdB